MNFQVKKPWWSVWGKTGMALVTFLLKEGAQVMVSDSRELSELKEMVSVFNGAGPSLVLEGGGHRTDFFLTADMVLVSPGIPLDIPALESRPGNRDPDPW